MPNPSLCDLGDLGVNAVGVWYYSRVENAAAFPKPGSSLVGAGTQCMLRPQPNRTMNTRRTVEIVLLAALLATAAIEFKSSFSPQPAAVAGQLPRQEKIVRTIAKQAEQSGLPFLLVSIPVTVLLFLLQD